MKRIKRFILPIAIGVAVLTGMSFQSDFFEIAKQIDIYTTLFKELNKYYIDEINPAEVNKKAIDEMLENLDPYTRFYDAQGVEDARISATGEFGGIGAVTIQIGKKLLIRELLRNSPSEKAGLVPGDQIIKIDDFPVEQYPGEDVNVLINGPVNSTVDLEIVRNGEALRFSVERKRITDNPVPYKTMLDQEVGYISFTVFNQRASGSVKEAILDLNDEGMKKLIIDVRGNPGGLLNEAVDIANFFIDKNLVIVTTKGKAESMSNTFKTKNEPSEPEIPVVILIDGRSASASEILAGSLQDYDRAVVLGERSFGKGLVQQYKELSYGAQMKMTISKYYTPSGRCIQELDYTNMDSDGVVPKFSDAGRESYKTSNGRTVYGGGGIMPDVEIEKSTKNDITDKLLNSDVIFDYATQYYYKNKTIPSADAFELSSDDFDDLIEFVSDRHASFETDTENLLAEVMTAAGREGLDKDSKKHHESLVDKVRDSKIDALKENKDRILEILTEEIVKRYYYSEGVYIQKVSSDPVIKEAIELINDSSRYNDILNG